MKNPSSAALPPQLVTFDLFGTILRDRDPGTGHRRRKDELRVFLADSGVGHFEAEAVDSAYRGAERRSARSSAATGRQPMLDHFFSDIVSTLGASCHPETVAGGVVVLHEASTIESLEFAGPVLHQLFRASAAGVYLGIVSNNFFHAPSALLEVLHSEDLLRHFNTEAIAFSSVEGVAKPNPELFLRACTRMKVEPRRALHVGDSRETDYAGAQAAGIKCVLVDPWSDASVEKILSEAFSWTA